MVSVVYLEKWGGCLKAETPTVPNIEFFFIINFLDLISTYHVELNVLIVDFYQKVGWIYFYPEVVHDKYLRSFIINIETTIKKILNPPLPTRGVPKGGGGLDIPYWLIEFNILPVQTTDSILFTC